MTFRTSPTLRWCEHCSVGWSLSGPLQCWSCGAIALREKQVWLTMANPYGISPACNDMVTAALMSPPDWSDDPCTGKTLAAA